MGRGGAGARRWERGAIVLAVAAVMGAVVAAFIAFTPVVVTAGDLTYSCGTVVSDGAPIDGDR